MAGDAVILRGIRAVGRHGVLAEEQERGQPFSVDVDIELDLTGVGESDALEDTIDYGDTAERVRSIVETERFALLEALATRIADAVLTDGRVQAVEVTVRKLRPPVSVDLDHAGVRIRRTR